MKKWFTKQQVILLWSTGIIAGLLVIVNIVLNMQFSLLRKQAFSMQAPTVLAPVVLQPQEIKTSQVNDEASSGETVKKQKSVSSRFRIDKETGVVVIDEYFYKRYQEAALAEQEKNIAAAAQAKQAAEEKSLLKE